ncbi:MAG: two-component system, NarL family, response regulator YdfI [Frankiaceae bacterium]|jgi:DNA-binding NarL/FixJ family response regulator|nr:two-component system, NarL family, response regulator YdfI [Frankiaceae bacterium]
MSQLSPQQRRVLRDAALGMTAKEIAGDLSISERTVKWHLANIYRRLGVHSRTEAVVVALELGYLRLPGQDKKTTTT